MMLGRLSRKDIDHITVSILSAGRADASGWQKAEMVFNSTAYLFDRKAAWVIKTVIQMVYAICKIDKPSL